MPESVMVSTLRGHIDRFSDACVVFVTLIGEQHILGSSGWIACLPFDQSK
jgi:hypothetical protein